ncbi:cation-transporting P-type ATPase [Bifidobacterium sp. MA2]|uniref:Cation-transporting P-type ATPase n=1 Tax=Bifidobacterium santillanense TaxID=2809028 RepID=A0ABS5UQT5_9BIFI|nr:cation-transporting P-type ATPase [Bifidobacterium santillanense]MBT1173331.1 cation-transporting P-type ATPase [Bifidobacterium santillanense]
MGAMDMTQASRSGLSGRLRKPQERASAYSMDEISTLPVDRVYQAMGTDAAGLSRTQAEIRLAKYGRNAIEEERKTPTVVVFLRSFTHLMALLLWAAGAIAFVAGMAELGVAVWLVNVINGVFSFCQEYRAGKAAEALKRMLPQYVTVIRDGATEKLPVEDLVPGDVFTLEEGDAISADARLVEANNLQVNQSTLNGESTPARKNAAAARIEGLSAAEIPNLVFAGTSVSEGNGRAVVVRTGMNTRFGRIARLTQNVGDADSPLQRELNHLTRQITIFATCVGAVFLLLDILFVHNPLAQAFIFALGMMVAFIPEGLLPTVTLALAMAVQRMSKRNALVKKLSSVESLGCTSVICTDKTGTLTRNEMTVEYLWTPEREYHVTGTGYDAREGRIEERGGTGRVWTAADDPALRELVVGGALCTNAHLHAPDAESSVMTDRPAPAPEADHGPNAIPEVLDDHAPSANGRWQVYGDPTEACLLVSCQKAGLEPDDLARTMPRVAELPFDSRRKRMTVIDRVPADGNAPASGITSDGASSADRLVAFTKGAPNEVVRLATRVRVGGRIEPMTDDLRERIMAANDAYADRGLRVLAVASRELDADERAAALADAGPGPTGPDPVPAGAVALTPESIERDLTFVGLEAMVDPPRPEVAAAVDKCRSAGIRIIMITGDYGRTAMAIARRIGIVEGPHARVISGPDLGAMTDAELTEALRGEVIFARMAPEQKLRVVSCLQNMGEIVATTGDGVNDAPALKKADVGVAMGVTGTDVAKEAADIILTDDNFASIVAAIEEGRAVYANIRRFLLYILNSNMPEAVPSAVYLFSGGLIPLPLTTMQILTIDLGTDMLPALGLGTEPPEEGVMDQPPRDPHERLLNRHTLLKAFLWYGVLGTIASLVGYFLVNVMNGWPSVPLAGLADDWDPVYVTATTMTLASIVFAQIGAVWNCRTGHASAFSVGLFSNRTVNIGIVVEIALIVLITSVPVLQRVFHTAPLGLDDYLYLAVIPFAILGIEEARKWVFRRFVDRRPSRRRRWASAMGEPADYGGPEDSARR